MPWPKRWMRRLRAVVRRDAVERELDEELAHHLELETEKNIRAGMSPAEARRQAALAFGGVDRFKEEVRDARAFGWMSGVSLDLKLGGRMLAKYPGLTVVGALGMAVAIAIAAVFDSSLSVANSPVPTAEGERLVALEVWDAEINNQERQIADDFATWREELESIEELGAYRTVTRNLIIPGGSTEPLQVAEMTASGFRIARVPPLLGRPLVPEDEAQGAPPVVVLGHELWRSRFGGDPDVLGREVRLGNVVHTVVGVMPEGFEFPLNHRIWLPLRIDAASYEPREGPSLQAFGLLAPGVSLEEAQAELTTVGLRRAAEFPETHRRLRPRVVQYGPHLLDDMQGWEIPMLRGLILFLLIVISVNVAVLVFARTATRSGEITVRTALGASRKRIVTQFFAESLVLAGVAAALGIGLAWVSLRRLEGVMDGLLAPMGGLPFWVDFRLSGSSVLFVVGLAVLAAVIVGIVPALQATGPRVQDALRALGGATGMRLGRTWTLLIIAQVTFAVAMLPPAVYYVAQFVHYGMMEPGFAAEEYLTSLIVMEQEQPGAGGAGPESDVPAFGARYEQRMGELTRRIEAAPEVSGVTLALHLPGEEPGVKIETEPAPGAAAGATRHDVRFNRVDSGFLETFEIPVLSGRALAGADFSGAGSPVLVNRSFVDDVLGGKSPLGRRIRYVEGYRSGGVVWMPEGVEEGEWFEIVGVVGDLPPHEMEPASASARVYHPLTEIVYPVRVAVRTRGAPAAFAPRMRELTASVDPTLQTRGLMAMDESLRKMQGSMRMGALGLGLVTASVLLLSAAGIYALTSFTVTRRRKEIGIRTALGAQPKRIVMSIFSRAAAQLALGAAIGLTLAGLLDLASGGELTGGSGAIVLPAVALLMLLVGLAAAVGPARRGLRIQPMEALRED